MDLYAENRKILYIDDEEELLKSFNSLMRKENCQVRTLNDSTRIREMLEEEGPFAVILSDQRMPDYDGVKVLEICKNIMPDAVRILITGYADQKDTIRAVNIGGIHSYISKPWDDVEIRSKVQEWISQYNLKAENKYLLKALDEENEKLNELLEGTVAQTVKVLGDIASNVAPQVASYGERVKTIGNKFLQNITGITTKERWEIMRALDLFNLGITLLPPSVQLEITKEGLSALKKSSLTNNHHLLAAGLLKEIPRFGPVARIIELQLKNYDGSGEPKNDHIKGNEIPLGARLLRILVDIVKPGNVITDLSDLLPRMEESPYKYDIELLKRLKQSEAERPKITGESFLPVNMLKPGMLVKADVHTLKGHQLLLKGGSILTETFIKILLQWHKRDPIEEPIRVSN